MLRTPASGLWGDGELIHNAAGGNNGRCTLFIFCFSSSDLTGPFKVTVPFCVMILMLCA